MMMCVFNRLDTARTSWITGSQKPIRMQHRKVEMANIKRLINKEDRVRHCNTYLNWIPEKRMWQSYIQRDINSEYCILYKLKA